MSKEKKLSFILLSALAALALCLGITFLGIPNAAYAADGAAAQEETSVAEVTADGISTYYDTFETAVASAAAGSTVTLLKDVTLADTLTIDKSLTLDLGGKTVTISGTDLTHEIVIDNVDAEVTIKNGTVACSGSGDANNNQGQEINVKNAKKATITDITLNSGRNNGIGDYSGGTNIYRNITGKTGQKKGTGGLIYSENSGSITVEDCHAKIILDDYNASAVYLNGTGSSTVRNLIVDGYTHTTGSHYGYGIRNHASGNTTISNCQLNDCRYGIDVIASGDTTIDGCILDGCYYGLHFSASGNIDVRNTEMLDADFAGMSVFGMGVGKTTGSIYMENCQFSGYWYGITGNGSAEYASPDEGIYLKDCTVSGYCGIYHPQGGTLTIDGGTIKAVVHKEVDYKGIHYAVLACSGVEVRAGTLIVKNRANISVPREVASFAAANGSGTTVFGAAIAVSQHYTDQKIPINVVIEDAVLDADTSLYQVDTKPTDTAHKVDVSITINDGKFQGGTQDIRIDDLRKEEIKNFIGGGEFDVQPDPSYVATTSTVLQVGDEYFVVPLATTDVEKAQQEADDYVRLYAASKNVEYTDDIRSLIYSAEVTTLDDVYVRRSVAISMVDNKYEQLKTAKLTAIERITAASAAKEATDTQEAQAAVVVPTSTLAAINAAINENQVAEFERNAIAEIEDIRAYRKEIADLIGTNCAEVLDAIKAFRETLLGDGTEANVGKLAQVQTELEAKIKAVQDKVDTLATSDELSAAKNDLTASIETAVSTLTGKIDEVKTVANSNATALENLGVDVSDVKTAIAAIDAVDAATLQEKLTALQMAIATAVSTAQTQLTEKIEALDAKMNTLTGRVNEVNSGLASEIDELDAKIAKLGTFSDNSLEAELGEIDAKLVAIASKVSAAVNVESEKSRASERIQNILNGLIGVEEAGGESPAAEQSAASNGLTDTEREKLHEVYSDKIATLIEQYYNEAIDGVANATTAEEAHSAADNFKRNVDTAKMIDSLGSKEQASLQPIYALLIIAVVLAVVAIILTIAFHAKKKSKE